MRNVDNSQDILDSRDVIDRIKELRDERDALSAGKLTSELNEWISEYADELSALESFADELRGYGDFEHGETLIRESYFEDYARELAEDCDLIRDANKWPIYCIDWEAAANNLRVDYTTADFDGVEYLMRA